MSDYPVHTSCPEDLYVEPPVESVLDQVRREMWTKYRIANADAFVENYVNFACNRTAQQVLSGEQLMPPGTVDCVIAYRDFHESIGTIAAYNRVAQERREEINALVAKVSKKGATVADREELGSKTNAYVDFTNKAHLARRKLWVLSGQFPIDGAKFHKDMLTYQRLFIMERFKASGYVDLSIHSV